MGYRSSVTLMSLIGNVNNLNDPKPGWNEQSTILGVLLTFTTLSVLCICLRLYIRFFVVKSPGWDDVFVFLFLITGTWGSIMTCTLTTSGLGQHFLQLKPEVTTIYLKKFYVANATYTLSTTFIKLSLLFQYLSIFKRGTFLRHFTIGMAVLIGLWGVGFSFMAWFPCFPVSAYWNFNDWVHMEDAKCYAFGSKYAAEFTAIYEIHGGFNMVFDIVVLGLPVFIYLGKALTGPERRGLLALFVMGTLVNVFSVWRLVTIVIHRAATYPTFDPTWYAPVSLIQACLEVDMASICASIPIFWPVLAAKFGLSDISVTREIIITREDVNAEHELELCKSASDGRTSMQSRVGSESGLNLQRGVEGHYNDAYVQDQVDPLREDKMGIVMAEVTVGAMNDGLEKVKSRSEYLRRL